MMENGLIDMPDYKQIEDEMFPPLPPPHSPGQGGDGADPFGDEEGEVSKLADVPAAKKKGVKRPQPKLDSQRLISERGLPALRTLFDNVKFQGKGHEAEDLRLLMQKMENWAHRLYPKLQFEDFIDKVEKLGAKKEVQTCLKRIRLDMPLTHDDFITKDVEEGTPAGQQVFGEPEPEPFGSVSFHHDTEGPVHSTPAAPSLTEEQRKQIELKKQLALERRLARMQQQQQQSVEEGTPAGQQVFGEPEPDPFGSVSFHHDTEGPVHSTPAASSLTEEQRKQIELKKQLALERRLARMQQQQQQQSDPSPSQHMSSPLPADEPSASSSSHLSQGEKEHKEQDMDREQGSSSEQPKNTPQKDSPRCEKGDGGLTVVPQLSNGCEDDGD